MRHFNLTILLLLFLILQNFSFGQTDSLRIKNLVDKLTWGSIKEDCIGTVLTLTHKDSTEQVLIKIGQPATSQLLKSLDVSGKTVICHIILTQIWCTEKEKNSFGTKYIYKLCNKLDGWHHVYNGLVWEWSSKTNNTITQEEIQKIKKYWNDKLINHKEIAFDREEIWNEVDKQDKLLYPCEKKYENNSSQVKFDELFSLLGKKVDDPLAKQLWTKLGNDSVMDYFSDCFFVNCREDGLEIRYNEKGLLTTIWIKKNYKGGLPYNLKPNNNKTQVENIMGPSKKVDQFYGRTRLDYPDKNLGFVFDEKGEILEFYINRK